MTAHKIAPKLLSWASDIEQGTVDQAARTSRLPFVEGHVALMPDAHVGIGSTVGSVVPKRGAIIPACPTPSTRWCRWSPGGSPRAGAGGTMRVRGTAGGGSAVAVPP